ncbi:MAG: sugar (pentulose or hexulose) kinase/phosphoglycerate dehydrogenase-like enzyme/ribulose-5-phosphate 4-epimerase [Halioglobus sp.]|jgi:sugar (pentulose or hexulose) kinase/phosphoglycerate dehydrogenase-like enzyme/ribulose-5-phosphate 4-epimerase/fuculose-1-phosphate aldolase/putative sterol carrier protein
MDKPWLMGIDLGGSGARCMLVDRQSTKRQSASGSWKFPSAKGTFGTGFDLDLDTIWEVAGKACRDALQLADIDGTQVAAVAVSSMRFSTVLIDASGNSLLAFPNRDARSIGESFELAEKYGETLLQQTGTWPLSLHVSSRLQWLKANDPDAFAKVHSVLGMGEWLNYKLCGERGIDPSQASATGLFSLTEKQWCWEMIEQLGLPREIFPTVLDAGSVLGSLLCGSAEHIGLPTGVPIAVGGADTQCSLLGAAVIDAGECAVVAGTTAPVQVVLDKPLHDVTGQMIGSHHVVPGRWVLESNGGTMGESVSLMANMLFPEATQPELRLLAEAELAEPGAAGMLSTLGADIVNMRSLALPVGQMTMSHMSCADDPAPRGHLVRALVEGCACALRANIECLDGALSSQAPGQSYATNPNKISLCGGMSRSDLFAQVVANIAGREVQVPASHQTSALGAAICAGIATGDYADFAAASESMCSSRANFAVQDENSDLYTALYSAWSRFREQSQVSTAPIAADQLLPWVLREPADTQSSPDVPAGGLQALVSASFDEGSLARLRANMDVEYASFREVKRLLTGPDLVKALADKQVFVTEVDVVDASALGQLPNLRVIAACRGDAVNVDVEACTAFGIPVLFAPGRNAVAVADLTVGFMLNLARKLPAATVFLKQADCNAGNMGKLGQAFSQLQGNELWHKTIGLVGLGAVGRSVAQRLAGFEVRILVSDPFVTPEQAALAGCELTDLNTLLSDSDFVSVHAAVTPGTTGMIAAEQFALMKPSAFFINTARAALIDEQALVDALQTDLIAGAALDTFAVEPPGFDHPLVLHPNVISTPHSAGNTVEVANHQGESVSAALLQLLAGESPRCVLNPETLENFSWTAPRPQPDEDELARLTSKSGPAVSDLQRDAKAKEQQATKPAGEVTAPAAIIEKMSAILATFCAGMAADPDIIAFSADQDVTLCFNIHDLGLDFHLALKQGEVFSALGPPPCESEVQLEMRGEIVDGMFTGTVDTMECAMNGEISFMGDAAKAMTLQHMNDDMERIYKVARATVGDPGDLSSIPRPSAAGAQPVDVEPGDIREDLVSIMQELYESQVITATGGNISVRIPGTESEVWITPSRLFKGDLKPEVMVRINLEGESLDTGARSPSSEWCMHTQILIRKSEATAVIHAHAPNATILANAGLPFLPISTEAAFFGNIPRVPFLMPGTTELAEAVGEAIEGEWAVLMINHGIIVGGRTLRRAADMVEIIERSAEVILGCYALGKEPPVLPPDAVEHFRKLGDIVA